MLDRIWVPHEGKYKSGDRYYYVKCCYCKKVNSFFLVKKTKEIVSQKLCVHFKKVKDDFVYFSNDKKHIEKNEKVKEKKEEVEEIGLFDKVIK